MKVITSGTTLCMLLLLLLLFYDYYDYIIIKRESEVSEAFSLVMKTHNCLRRTYVSSPRIDPHMPFGPGDNEPLPPLE